MNKEKKMGRAEYLILMTVVGLLNFGLTMIVNTINKIYELYTPHFLIYWGILLLFSFVGGFFYIAIWKIIQTYFGKVVIK